MALRVKSLPPTGNGLAPYAGREVDLEGEVVDDPEPADSLLAVRLRVDTANGE